MAEKYSRGERNLGVAEAATGAGIGLAAASGKVPEIVNRWARRDRKAKYEYAKHMMKHNDPQGDKPDYNKGHGYDKKNKKWVKLNALPEDRSEPKVNTDPKTGKTYINGTKIVSPRKEAFNAAHEHFRHVENKYRDPVNVPFPDARWQYNKKGKKKKLVPKVDPATGAKIADKTGKTIKVQQAAKIGQMRRSAVPAIGIPVAAGLIWHGTRTMAHQGDIRRGEVVKALTRGETDGAVVGGAIGGALYQAPSFTEWGGRSKEDKSLMKKKKTAKIITDWKTKYDLHGLQRGDPRWTKAYRHYPKQLPGSQMRRVMSYTHAGGTGLAATGAAIGAGALIGAGAVHSGKKHRVRRTA